MMERFIVISQLERPALKKARSSKALVQKKNTILLVDDHPLFRKGMMQLLDSQADLEVAAEAENSNGTLRLASSRSGGVNDFL